MIGLCPGLVIFTTCCQAPSGSARSGSTATRTSAPGTLRAAASVTLTAIAVRAGVHASAVRRYYSSREEILLTLAEEGYRDWAHDIATRLSGRQEVTSGELARILTASLAERQLFCDLLTHVTLSLEREVSFERVHAFKSVAIIAVGTLAGAITAASTLNQDQASDLIIGVIAMTAPLWQAGHIGIDFEPTLTRLITALIDGMTHGPSAG